MNGKLGSKKSEIFRKAAILLNRDDFRSNPPKALAKRVYYRLRWRFWDRPWPLSYAGNFKITVPKGGGGALIFYQGSSEPPVKTFLERFLRKGDTFVDIGAHFGEFTLLASKLVGPGGRVFAFEPSPVMVDFLASNVRRNGITNAQILPIAVSDFDGKMQFRVTTEPGLSHLTRPLEEPDDNELDVTSTSLDSWSIGLPGRIDLIKVDVEGAELAVFRGARRLLSQPGAEAPLWIFEFEPSSWAAYGHTIEDATQLLTNLGYNLGIFTEREGIRGIDPADAFFESRKFSTNLIAFKPEHKHRFAEESLPA